MTTRKGKLFSPTWISGLRSATAASTRALLLTSQAGATAIDERQPSAAEIVQPVAKSYQELQQALAGPVPKTPLTPDQIVARLDKLFPMSEQAEKQISRDAFDPQAIIDKVGKDPKKIFVWVRDNTCFVPYRGLQVVGIDVFDSDDAARHCAAKHKANYPILREDQATQMAWIGETRNWSTFFVTPDGKILKKITDSINDGIEQPVFTQYAEYLVEARK